MYFVGKINNNG